MPAQAARLVDRVARLVGRQGARRVAAAPANARGASLELRVDHLEKMVEALQDQLYRQAQREEERFAAMQHSLQPDELARVLSAEARRRGTS